MGRCPVKPNGGQIRARQPDRQLHFGVVQCAVHGLGRWTQNTPFLTIVCGADVITLAGSSKCRAPVCTELCCVPYARPSLTVRIANNAAANRTAGGYSQRAAGGKRGAAFNFKGRRRKEPLGGGDRRATPLAPCLTVRPKAQARSNRAHRGTCWNQGRRDYVGSLAYIPHRARSFILLPKNPSPRERAKSARNL
jgi:hypothetical protein